MSAKSEADIETLKGQMRDLQQHMAVLSNNCFTAIEAMSERIDLLSGETPEAKASPNGKVQNKKTYR